MKVYLLFMITYINKVMYHQYNQKDTTIPPLTLFKCGFAQKILGINRHIPWPVHWTSTINSAEKIKPGSRTPGLSKGCHIDGRNGIKIGSNVWIGPHVKIISMNHDQNNFYKYIKAAPIKIGDNCWLGANSIILAEVELGAHTIVAAGSVVTKSFPKKNQILAGNPARIIKQLPNYAGTK